MDSIKTTSLERRERFVVTQSNTLIEAEYSTELTARAHKTARLILSLVSPEDKNLRLYTIPVSAVKSYLGMSSNSKWGGFTKELDGIATRLREKPIKIKQPNGDRINAVFLSAFKISPTQGTITFEISELLKPYLLELKKNYTSYLLNYIPKLRSSYSIRLYELLFQYSKIGRRYFELNELQRLVGSSYHNKYNNFKRKVLLQAQGDLKQHTNVAFIFNEKKEGRKIVGIEFILFGNTPEEKQSNQLSFLEDAFDNNDEQDEPILPETIIKAMNELGISEQNIAKYLAMSFEIISEKDKRKEVIKRCETLENYYLEKLELTKRSANSENAAGFFIKALKEDWAKSKTLQKTKANSAIKERNQAQRKLQSLMAEIENLSNERKALKAPIIADLIADDNKLESIYGAAMEGLGSFIRSQISDVLHLPIRKQYEQSIHISSRVGVYLLKTYPKHFEGVNKVGGKIEKIQQEIQAIRKKYPSIK